MSRNKLSDRIVVITGAAGGFGNALVSALSPLGASLALADLSESALSELADTATHLGAKDVMTSVVDVTDETSVKTFYAGIEEHYGRADILVNLPGMSIASPVEEMPVESYDRIMDVNLKGLFLATKHFISLTRAEHSPLIAYISSQAATRPNSNAPVYCAAKAAVSIFGQGLALQVMKKDIRVTAIKPGPVNTSGFWGDRPVPREKFMQASDVADVISFVIGMPEHLVMHEVSFESFAFFKK